jgi:hypothetical protein
MIYKNFDEGITVNDVSFAVGQKVIGNSNSEYEGLLGTIMEIRTDPDKDTENEGPDIYCSFEPPEDPKGIKELEAVFSELYGEPKSIDEIILDEVIMSPDMLDTSND